MNIGNIGPHLLQSKRSQPLGWHTAVGELVDNSFDADASRVVLDFSKNRALVVEDDGNGCPDVRRMLTIADHKPTSSTRLGRYGVGLKDAGCWLWGELQIETVHRGKSMVARVNWERLSKQKDWEIDDPVECPPKEDFERGTRLRFLRIDRNRPQLDKVAEELGYTFWPALTAGKQIVVVGPRGVRSVCSPWSPPPLTKVIEDAFSVDGKLVEIRVGIVPSDDSNPHFGFNFSYGHRNIQNSSLGSNGRSVSRICGVVKLGNGWRLSTNKTSICDGQEELGEAIWSRCQEIIEDAQTQAESIFNRELESSVTESLRSYLASSKRAKRGKGDSSGAVEPKGTGRKHRKASKTQNKPGPIEDMVDVGKIRMEWCGREDGRLGHVDLPGNVVYLNNNHARLSQHREAQNRDAIVDMCMTLITTEVFDQNEKHKFPFARNHETIVEALSYLANAQASTDVTRKNPA